MTEQSTRVFRFGPFKADLGNRQLFRSGVPVSLTGQPFDILALLLESPGQLVTREQLRARLWPSGTIVEFDHSIDAAITRLREVLGDQAQRPRFIATVPRHGYRFIAPVSKPASPTSKESAVLPPRADQAPDLSGPDRNVASGTDPTAVPAPWYVRAAHLLSRRAAVIIAVVTVGAAYIVVDKTWFTQRSAAIQPVASGIQPVASQAPSTTVHAFEPSPNSIAVLPFADMSANKDQEYFADGLAEELLDLLGKTPGLHVVARTSSFSFKGKSDDIPTVAEKLRVANILEGSVRRSGDRVRVTTQLVRATDGEHLWSETYDRELKDIFEVQDEIAAAVAAALKLKLATGQRSLPSRSGNTDAYLQYLLGQQYFGRGNDDDFRRSVGAYEQAVALDPNYAAAYAGLAMAEAYLGGDTGDKAELERARVAAEKAISLAPDEAPGYAARGFQRFSFDWDWSGAERDLAKALDLDPTNPFVLRYYSALLVYLGRLPEGIAVSRKTTDLDPFSAQAWNTLAWNLIPSGDLAAARDALRRALTINPAYAYALENLGVIDLIERKPTEALAVFQKIPGDQATCPLGWRLSGIAIAEHLLGHVDESQRAVDEAIAKVARCAAYQIAEAYAGRGEADKAFEWLERAYQQRDGGLTGLRRDPLLVSLRSDPRYRAMLKKINLPE